MPTTDTQVQLAPDSTGAKVDNSAVTRADGTVVDRQRINLSDPSEVNCHQNVHGEDGRGAAEVSSREILAQLRLMNQTLGQMFELLAEILAH
jgi:hypothetical protein